MTTPVQSWTPSLAEAVRLARRPLLAYAVFTATGFLAFFLILAYYDRPSSLFEVFFAIVAGIFGVAVGQLISLFRFRTLPVLVAGIFVVMAVVYILGLLGNPLPKVLVIALVFFAMAVPSGLLSMHHRFELLSVFWPSVGWIGSVMIILNEEGRIKQWESSKISAWLPVPLLLLACFLVGLLFFMASKQAMRVTLWESLSGATERRVHRSGGVSAVPRKNILPLLGAAALLFAFTAVLAPYLWRTGKGDRPGKNGKPDTDEPGKVKKPGDGDGDPLPERPKFDEEAMKRAMDQAGQAAKSAAHTLWPLLLLALFYRPIKRAALTSHLVTPIFPTPPSERIDNLWEYLRIAAEDTGVVPLASDSVEDLLSRIEASGVGSPELQEAARIYARTRYGFVVAPGDGLAMKRVTIPASRALRSPMTRWDHLKSWWRPLS